MSEPDQKAKRPRLSAALIVKDEEAVLAQSIESLQSIVDEIVVLDTGSTDQTLQIAGQLGATVVSAPLNDDFSAARNECLRRTTGDWVLWLNASERLDADSARQLREFVDQSAESNKAYMILVETPEANSGGLAEQKAQIRLIPRDDRLRFEGRVRETLHPAIQAAGLEIDVAPGRIVRHPRGHDQGRKALIAYRNLRLIGLEIDQQKATSARLELAAGESYSDLGDHENARQSFGRAIELAEQGSGEMLDAYYGLVTSYDGDEYFSTLQLSTCVEALEAFPLDAQLLMAMGNYLQQREQLAMAERCFRNAVQHGQVDLQVWHVVELAELASISLGLILQLQQKEDEARQVFEDALKCHPESIRLRRHMLELHVKHGRCEEALQVANHLPLPAEQRAPMQNAVRGACRVADNVWTSATAYLQGAYVAGCRDVFCLRWLVVALLSNAQVEAAKPVLEQWRQREPDSAELQVYLDAIAQAEVEPAGFESSHAEAAPSALHQHFRIDQGTTSLQVSPPPVPFISQISSFDDVANQSAPVDG